MSISEIVMLALWLGFGWVMIFKVHYCDVMFSLELLHVSKLWWFAYPAMILSLFLWPISPLIVTWFLKKALPIMERRKKERGE